MNDDWIQRQRRAAADDLADTDTLLDRIEDWQTRAQAAAEEHTTAATKKAVREQPPDEAEAGALFGLYARHAETVFHVCREELERASEVDALTLEGVLQEAYVLFQRALVGYDPDKGPLNLYLAHALRQRIRDYISAHSHETSEDEAEVADESIIAPGYNIPEIYASLVAEGAVADAAAELFDSCHPST